MTKNQYKKLLRMQRELCELSGFITGTVLDKRLKFENGSESEQIDCAIAALECILQEVSL